LPLTPGPSSSRRYSDRTSPSLAFFINPLFRTRHCARAGKSVTYLATTSKDCDFVTAQALSSSASHAAAGRE
jgi:hypothetical protein